MHWIYILRCEIEGEEGSKYYIGETKRLFRRFWEHEGGSGGTNTSMFDYIEVIAIYKARNITNFIEYNRKIKNILKDDGLLWTYTRGFNNPIYLLSNWNETEYDAHLEAENCIAECMIINNEPIWKNIRGGKYVRFDRDYTFPTSNHDIPLCKCNLPCDVRKIDDSDYIFFRCCRKNMFDDFREAFDNDDEPCNFYLKYGKDAEVRRKYDDNHRFKSSILTEPFSDE
ncbi:GIY-YIG nuclease family protein [bacterium]|nr:GIY-YIG nuclease family protein [bacterium]